MQLALLFSLGSYFAPVPSAERLFYTVAPSARPLSAVVYSPGFPFPAPSPACVRRFWGGVRGQVPFPAPSPVSSSGVGGVRDRQGRPLTSRAQPPTFPARFPRIGRQFLLSRNHEGNRSWGAPSRGVFGEGVPAVVEDLDYSDYHHQGDFYSSDPYYSHSVVRPPPF